MITKFENSTGNISLYPNPATNQAWVKYELDSPSNVKLTITDAIGKTVLVLLDDSQAKGKHKISFQTNSLQAGMYFFRLESENWAETKRLMIVK